jgi:hypothetical protein
MKSITVPGISEPVSLVDRVINTRDYHSLWEVFILLRLLFHAPIAILNLLLFDLEQRKYILHGLILNFFSFYCLGVHIFIEQNSGFPIFSQNKLCRRQFDI